MSVFKLDPLLVVVLFGVLAALCLLAHSAYKFFKTLEYEKPFDVEAQVLQICPKVIEPNEPSATYQTNKVGSNRIRKTLAFPVIRLGHFFFSNRRTRSASILDESFTCIDKDIVRRSVYDQSPILFYNRELFRQPRPRSVEDVPSPFDIYVSSRHPQISTETRDQPRSPPLRRSTPRTPPSDVWWLSANIIVKPTESMEQKPITTNTRDHDRRRSVPIVLDDISNKNAPILLFTPPTPKKAVQWSGKRISQATVNSSHVSPVMKSLKAQGRKPPDPRPQPIVHKRLLEEIKEGIPEGYF